MGPCALESGGIVGQLLSFCEERAHLLWSLLMWWILVFYRIGIGERNRLYRCWIVAGGSSFETAPSCYW